MNEEEFEIKMEAILQDKKKILDSIFISREKASNIIEFQKRVNEVDLMIKCAELSAKLDRIVELLGNVLRKHDPKGRDKMLQDIFIKFYTQLDEFESMKHLQNLHNVLNPNKESLDNLDEKGSR